jgi:hypothetical protein
VEILQKHHIPFQKNEDVNGFSTLLPKQRVDPQHLRRLGFRISRSIGDQLIVCYKGKRVGIVA